MKSFACLLALGLLIQIARGDTLQRISRDQFADLQKLPAGVSAKIVGEGMAAEIEMKSDGSAAAGVNLLLLKQPKITTKFYAIVGQVRYDDVAGNGYLEMWSHFGELAAYFSRTLGDGGPMGKLTGHSDWRAFILPFNATGANGSPTSLELNVRLPGKGTVVLRQVELRQAGSMEELFGAATGPRAWWSDRDAGLLCGLAGGVIGCLGGLLEWLARAGRARQFVVVTTWTLIGVGTAAVAACVVALAQHQPYGVWFGLGLTGALCVLIFPFRLQRYGRQYRDSELRRMSSLDALGA